MHHSLHHLVMITTSVRDIWKVEFSTSMSVRTEHGNSYLRYKQRVQRQCSRIAENISRCPLPIRYMQLTMSIISLIVIMRRTIAMICMLPVVHNNDYTVMRIQHT